MLELNPPDPRSTPKILSKTPLSHFTGGGGGAITKEASKENSTPKKDGDKSPSSAKKPAVIGTKKS